MSPSHVGYYYDNKASILEEYAEAVCRQNLAQLPDLQEADEERLLDELARFCLGEGRTSVGVLGVIQELSGLAVHDERLFEIKSRHTRAWRAYLEQLFERVPPAHGLAPRQAAWLAHGILVGLNTNALFDDALERGVAHDLFRRSLRDLADLGTPTRRAAGAARSRRPRGAASRTTPRRRR